MKQIVRRAFRSTPIRAEMRALGLTHHIPLGTTVIFLFGCAEVVATVASLAAL
jgi:hypothetical protein